MAFGLIRCSNCEEDLPEDQFNDFELGKIDSICDQCLDEMAEDDEDEIAEDSEDEEESEDDSL